MIDCAIWFCVIIVLTASIIFQRPQRKHKRSHHSRRRSSSSSSSSDSTSGSDSEDNDKGFKGSNKRRKPEEEVEHADLTGSDSTGATKALAGQARSKANGESNVDKLGFQRPAEPVVERESWMMLPPPSSRVAKPAVEDTKQEPVNKIDNYVVHSKELNPQLNPNSPLAGSCFTVNL
jgi:hypothetical protein